MIIANFISLDQILFSLPKSRSTGQAQSLRLFSVYSTHGIHDLNHTPPEGDEFEPTRGQPIIAGRGRSTASADRPAFLPRTNLDRKGSLALFLYQIALPISRGLVFMRVFQHATLFSPYSAVFN